MADRPPSVSYNECLTLSLKPEAVWRLLSEGGRPRCPGGLKVKRTKHGRTEASADIHRQIPGAATTSASGSREVVLLAHVAKDASRCYAATAAILPLVDQNRKRAGGGAILCEVRRVGCRVTTSGVELAEARTVSAFRRRRRTDHGLFVDAVFALRRVRWRRPGFRTGSSVDARVGDVLVVVVRLPVADVVGTGVKRRRGCCSVARAELGVVVAASSQ